MAGMEYTLCICSDLPGMARTFGRLIGTSLFSKVVLCSSDPSVEFKEVKETAEKIVLLVLGPLGHDGIKLLCDDYRKPREERRIGWVHSVSAGVDWYRLNELTTELEGIPFTNGRGCFSSILAEHVIYAMLYFSRQTWRLQASRAEHKWDPFNMVELRGLKMGIIGYGDIGHATAKLATAFGMDVTGVKRSAPAKDVDEYGVRLVHGEAELKRVLSESDFVVNVLPGTDETKEFFNKERFAMMKPEGYYINIGRGITQNENDLAAALRNGTIRGAAVDVFQKEPLGPESPLWDISDDKILLSFHSAFMVNGVERRIVDCFVRRAEEFGTSAFDSNQVRLE
ncbi:putative D-isomer specific 2-hydroxyacid dehydrogenase-protein [Trypanosoma grayi]|uniref:putative D-isomer specific 2-hydroxyacid dehydrogenase-protein n=1 Tax=Trypanosoma grayi TaxID=71804 RepID=UPI0004F44E2B|nr:putative D-isomer specific 2-hydroxyacid dehydrogenase-protein [Trypanosoma grayi]KEG13026.1 putative D-isomer specific 2-hydroxyacid dehydrogenase-protein [Trypanosoma grayi]